MTSSEESNIPTMLSEDTDWDKVEVDEATSPNNDNLNNNNNNNTNEPQSLQIVSVGTELDQYAFTFHEETLQSILEQIPTDLKVCVVSVVGAFRTGKSFLLSWFLRYLDLLHHNRSIDTDTTNNNNNNNNNKNQSNDNTNIDTTTHTSNKTTQKWYDQATTLGQSAFHWRGGSERNTTGIWMWSKPYILNNIAVLLVDTQGMFDHETTMGLTAAIFGLSTLLSSYQIYNVDKRIQEDNLQQLALFSEYGRMALQTDEKHDDNNNNDDNNDDVSPSKSSSTTTTASSTTTSPASLSSSKPFQKIEFLVRDWQNFEDEDDIQACEREMQTYLENVLAERDAADLKDTREQITSCFEQIQCYLMVHPGKAVTKKNYEGDVDSIDPTFKHFMDRYCERVFQHLVPKSIHGRELTATELGSYIRNYAKMFESGAHFPEAATMLEATSNANNTNAINLSVKKYKDEMDTVAGTQQTNYMNPMLLEEYHRTMLSESMRIFDDIACFGNKKAIDESRNEAVKSIQENFEVYTKLNEGRNPLAGLET